MVILLIFFYFLEFTNEGNILLMFQLSNFIFIGVRVFQRFFEEEQ